MSKPGFLPVSTLLLGTLLLLAAQLPPLTAIARPLSPRVDPDIKIPPPKARLLPGAWTVRAAKKAVFASYHPKTDKRINLASYSAVDPDRFANRETLQSEAPQPGLRFVMKSGDNGDYEVMERCDRHSFFYNHLGELQAVSVDSSPRFGDATCPKQYPVVTRQYHYPDGELITLILFASEEKAFFFTPDGKALQPEEQ